MLIRLNKGASSEGIGGPKALPVETVTVACPGHLILADLPVAKGLGSATAVSLVKMVGRRSRRLLGERVHFCVRCDFPIAIYGRLSPCEHVFCLDCARSDSICYLCDERIQKIQTIKMMEGIFICAAPHCLKSFMNQADFESHIQATHADLLQPNAEKEGNESTASDSTPRAPPPPPRPIFSPNSNTQPHDRDDKSRRLQPPREQPPPPPRPIMQPRPPIFPGQFQNYPPEPPGFDRPGPTNRFHQPSLDPPQESSLDPHLPNFPANSIPILQPPLPFGYPPFLPEGTQQFYNTTYEISRQDSATDLGSEQGSLMGFPPGPAGAGMNFPENFPRPWNVGPTSVPPFESLPQAIGDGFVNPTDFQGNYGRNPGNLPLNPHPQPLGNKGMEPTQGGNTVDIRESKSILTPQPMPPPPPPPPQATQLAPPPVNRGNFYPGDMGRDGQGYGWQHENRDGFGNGQ